MLHARSTAVPHRHGLCRVRSVRAVVHVGVLGHVPSWHCCPVLEVILPIPKALQSNSVLSIVKNWYFFIRADLILVKEKIDLATVCLPYAEGALVCICKVAEVAGCRA